MVSPKKKTSKAKPVKEKAVKKEESPPPPAPPANDNPSTDFEAGLLFERYKQEGKLDAKSFQNMWRERQKLAQQHAAIQQQQQQQGLQPGSGLGLGSTSGGGENGSDLDIILAESNNQDTIPRRRPSYVPDLPIAMEAGQLFERYDKDKDGRLSRQEFERLLADYITQKKDGNGNDSTSNLQQNSLPSDIGINHAPYPFQQQHSGPLSSSQSGGYPPYPNNANFNPPPYIQDYLAPPTILPPSSPLRNNQHLMKPRGVPSNGIGSGSNNGNTNNPYNNYTHYNETTGVPLPTEAVPKYSGIRGHVVVPLTQAFEKRKDKLQTLMTTYLLPREEALQQLGRKLRSMEEEIKTTRESIERETMADCTAILERLRSSEALKLSTLGFRMNEVEVELDSVQRLIHRIEVGEVTQEDMKDFSYQNHNDRENQNRDNYETGVDESKSMQMPQNNGTSDKDLATLGDELKKLSVSLDSKSPTPARMLNLITSYPELCAAIERISQRPIRKDVNVQTNDFPRETAERCETLRRCDKYENALSVKDQMVYELYQERNKLIESSASDEDLRQDYLDEIKEWAELANRLTSEVTRLKTEVGKNERLKDENDRLRRENTLILEALERRKKEDVKKKQEDTVI